MTSPDTETENTETTTAGSAEAAADGAAEQKAVVVAEAPQDDTVDAEAADAEAAKTEVVKAEAVEDGDDPNTVVFSLLGFFLAYIPLVGVIVNAVAVARAGKEGFDLFLARWGLVLAILSTLGALILVGLGFWIGLEAGRGGM